MAVDQDLLDQIAGTIADLYREVEASLITVIADELKKGLDAPTAEIKLDAVTRLRAAAQAVYQRLQKTKSEKVREAIRTAYRDGHASALTGLPVSKKIRDDAKQALKQVPNAATVENLAAALHRDLGMVEGNIFRAPVDAYRAVQASTAARIVTGTATRRQASQAAWQRLVDRGIVSFTDRAGRQWRLSSYAEMIGRTNAQRAMVAGQMDRLASVGIDLVYVSDNTQECKRCRPFESRVLRRTPGPVGRIRVEHGTRDGEMVTVDVLDTLDGARAKGLFHPNCRHSVSIYLPGVTTLKTGTEDPEGDQARQRQRALERRIRAAKEAELAALDEPAKTAAHGRVRAAQGDLRAHLKTHPTLKRLPYREQVGAGNIPGPGGPKGGPVGDLHPTPPTSPAPSMPDVEAAEGQARRAAEVAARRRAEAEAAAQARAEAEARARAATEARARARAEAEARVQARAEAEAKARAEAAEKARAEAEARAEATAQARAEAEAKAKAEAEAKAKAEAEAAEKARLEAEKKAAEEKAKREAEEKARQEAAKKAALEKAKREAAEAARKAAEEAARHATPGMHGLRHRSNKEGLDWARSALPMPDLTKEEKAGLRSYTGSAYQMVNRGLRGTPPANSRDRKQYDTIVSRCDAAFAKAGTPDAMVVHRGVGADAAKFLGADVDKPATMAALVGKDFVEHGYMSTSVGYSAAFPGKIYLMIRVPKGYPAMNVMPISVFGEGEREVMLQRGTRYVVHAAYQVGRAWHLEVEVVPEGWKKPAGWVPDPYGDAAEGYDRDGLPKEH